MILKVWLLPLLWGTLLPLPCHVAGQPKRQPKQEWRVANAAPTKFFWAVIELEFHTTSTCDDEVRERPISSGYVQISSTGAHPPGLAFDGDAQDILPTAWWSQCNGCNASEAWIGQSYSLLFPDVECVRIYQPPSPDHVTAEISLEFWNGTEWEQKQSFYNVGVGYFINLPIMPQTLWRILPLDVTQSGWSIAELTLHNDVECASGLGGVPSAFGFIGNGSAASDITNSPMKAQDGNEATAWVAPCMECQVLEPWLAVNLRNPGPVRCFRLLQEEARGSNAVLVQAWSGSDYSNASSFFMLSPGTWDHLIRWELCMHAPGRLWRFLPNETVTRQWTVAELEIYEDTNCSQSSPDGIPISSATLNSSNLAFANASAIFDADVLSSWRSPQSTGFGGVDWPGWYDGNQTTHVLGFPWFGVSLATNISRPRCFKFLQSNALVDATSSLVVQRWDGTAWDNYVDDVEFIGQVSFWYSGLTSSFTPKAPPSWSRLPALDRTQWRVTHIDLLWNHWAVKEARFYEWIECNQELSGTPIASGEDPAYSGHPSRDAFDKELSTEWWSHCYECRPRQAWLGLALPLPRNTRCIALLQSSQDPRNEQVPWWTQKAGIEKWNGHHWVDVAEAFGLGRGAWDNLFAYSHGPNFDDSLSGLPYWSTEEDTLWRVANTQVIPERWALPSLNFFTDLDCSERLDNAKQISSGYVIGFSMEKAQGNDFMSEWLSSCEACDIRQAWLGVHVPLSRWVRCVQLFQRVTVQSSTRSIAVERFSGTSWVQATFADQLAFGTWEIVYLPKPGIGSQDSRVRWRLVNAQATQESWSVGDLELYVSPSCTDKASGVQISSGYANAHELAKAFDDSSSTYWKSSCRTCAKGQAWLGISLPSTTAAVRCIQLWQSSDPAQVSTEVSVQIWASSNAWVEVAAFQGLNPGAWDALHILQVPALSSILNELPVLPEAPAVPAKSMWRIVNTAAIERSWAIRHLRFYGVDAGTHCAELLEGVPIASGYGLGYPPEGALTNNTGSTLPEGAIREWRSPCVGCAEGSAWLGLAFTTAVEVSCIEVEQADADMDSTPSLALESWDGSSAWTMARIFAGLSGGAAMRLSASWADPAPFQRFRIVNLLPVEVNWKVAELQFFLDLECSRPVHGTAVSSGSTKTAIPGLAFDGNVSTAWESSILAAPARGAWLGSHLYAPHDVKCTYLRQGDEPGKFARALAIERTAEDGWAVVYELNSLYEGAWFSLNTFASPFTDVKVNFQDMEAEPPPGYLLDFGDRYKDHGNGYLYGWNCQLEGFTRGVFIDLVWDTVVEMVCKGATWNFDLMRGFYYVEISYSNPGEGGSTSSCYLEDESVTAGQIPPFEKTSRKASVLINDGQLTFRSEEKDTCTAIAALDVRALPDALAMWRIVNKAPLSGRWRIEELEFHATALCSVNLFRVRQKRIIASGWADGAEPELAVDGDVGTAWESPCKGCTVDQAWLGAAFAQFALVKCIKLYQTANGDGQSNSVALERWNSTGWQLHQAFANTPGGNWGMYNDRWVEPLNYYRWRLVATEPTHGMLRVAEVRLFGDIGCQTQLDGFPIASHVMASAPAARAFDSSFNTEWVSQCGPCLAGEAWIGLHFKVPTTVMCAFAALPKESRRLTEHEGSVDRTPLQLEEWNGTSWAASGPVMLARANAWAAAHRITAVEDLPPGALWRIVNNVATTAPWRILELEFHTKAECNAVVADGEALASSQRQGFQASLAFDGSSDMLSSWIAGCSATGCPQQGEWIGKLFPQAYIFQCVRLYQGSASMAGDPAAKSIRLERWNGTDWELTRLFDGVTSGKWANLLVLDDTSKFASPSPEWRFVAESFVEKHWAITEIALFEQVECRQPLVGTVSASGQAGSQYVKYAIDGRLETAWWSQGNIGPGEAWISFTYGEERIVRCVRVLQYNDPLYAAEVVQLQARQGADWLHIASLSGVAMGQLQHFHVFDAVLDKKSGSMYRVMNYNTVPEGWVITELEFYSDQDCKRIEIGAPISSGYSLEEAEPNALDTVLGTYWRSQCRDCPRAAAWLGQSFFKSMDAGTGREDSSDSRSVQIACVILLQGGGADNSTSTVTLEAWTGSKWSRVEKFFNVPGGDFVQLRVGLEGNASVQIDGERKELMMQTTPSPAYLTQLRQVLQVNNDLIEMDVEMFVDFWPVELTIGRENSNAFAAAWARAVRVTFADRTNQPSVQIFVDNAVLKLPTFGAGQMVKPSMVARAFLYVVLPSANTGYWTTDSKAVYDFLDEVAADPMGVEAQFLVEVLKNELRAATRLEPLLASVVTQVEPSITVHLGKPVLKVAFETTPAPTTEPPTAAPVPKKDNTVLYILMLVLVIFTAVFVRCIYSCYYSRKKRREELDLWAVTHPGVPYPKLPSTWQKWKAQFRRIKSLRKNKDGKGKSVPDTSHQIVFHADQDLEEADNQIREELQHVSHHVKQGEESRPTRMSLSVGAAIAMGMAPELAQQGSGGVAGSRGERRRSSLSSDLNQEQRGSLASQTPNTMGKKRASLQSTATVATVKSAASQKALKGKTAKKVKTATFSEAGE